MRVNIYLYSLFPRTGKLFFLKLILSVLFLLQINIPVLGAENDSQAREGSYTENENQINVPRQMPEAIALRVAEDYLPKFFKGEYIYFDRFIYFDIYGHPATFAFVFRKAGSDIITINDLEDSINKNLVERNRLISELNEINSLKKIEFSKEKQNLKILTKKKLNHKVEDIYKLNDFVTILTGATEIAPLIIDYHFGIPRIIADKTDIYNYVKKKHSNDKIKIGRIIFLNAFDIRFEFKLGDENYLVEWQTRTVERLSEMLTKVQEIERKRERKRDLMTPDERSYYDELIRTRERENILKWEIFD